MADNHFLRMIGLCGESASVNNQYLRIISSRDKSSFFSPPPFPIKPEIIFIAKFWYISIAYGWIQTIRPGIKTNMDWLRLRNRPGMGEV